MVLGAQPRFQTFLGMSPSQAPALGSPSIYFVQTECYSKSPCGSSLVSHMLHSVGTLKGKTAAVLGDLAM